jgi:hypothetical protein
MNRGRTYDDRNKTNVKPAKKLSRAATYKDIVDCEFLDDESFTETKGQGGPVIIGLEESLLSIKDEVRNKPNNDPTPSKKSFKSHNEEDVIVSKGCKPKEELFALLDEESLIDQKVDHEFNAIEERYTLKEDTYGSKKTIKTGDLGKEEVKRTQLFRKDFHTTYETREKRVSHRITPLAQAKRDIALLLGHENTRHQDTILHMSFGDLRDYFDYEAIDRARTTYYSERVSSVKRGAKVNEHVDTFRYSTIDERRFYETNETNRPSSVKQFCEIGVNTDETWIVPYKNGTIFCSQVHNNIEINSTINANLMKLKQMEDDINIWKNQNQTYQFETETNRSFRDTEFVDKNRLETVVNYKVDTFRTVNSDRPRYNVGESHLVRYKDIGMSRGTRLHTENIVEQGDSRNTSRNFRTPRGHKSYENSPFKKQKDYSSLSMIEGKTVDKKELVRQKINDLISRLSSMRTDDDVDTIFDEEEDLRCRYSNVQSNIHISKTIEKIEKKPSISKNGLQVCSGVTNVNYNRLRKPFRVCYNEDFDIMADKSTRKDSTINKTELRRLIMESFLKGMKTDRFSLTIDSIDDGIDYLKQATKINKTTTKISTTTTSEKKKLTISSEILKNEPGCFSIIRKSPRVSKVFSIEKSQFEIENSADTSKKNKFKKPRVDDIIKNKADCFTIYQEKTKPKPYQVSNDINLTIGESTAEDTDSSMITTTTSSNKFRKFKRQLSKEEESFIRFNHITKNKPGCFSIISDEELIGKMMIKRFNRYIDTDSFEFSIKKLHEEVKKKKVKIIKKKITMTNESSEISTVQKSVSKEIEKDEGGFEITAFSFDVVNDDPEGGKKKKPLKTFKEDKFDFAIKRKEKPDLEISRVKDTRFTVTEYNPSFAKFNEIDRDSFTINKLMRKSFKIDPIEDNSITVTGNTDKSSTGNINYNVSAGESFTFSKGYSGEIVKTDGSVEEVKKVKKIVKVIKKINKSKTIDEMAELTNKTSYEITNSSVECLAKERVLPIFDITNTELSIIKAEPEVKEVKEVKKVVKVIKKIVKSKTIDEMAELTNKAAYQITNSSVECIAKERVLPALDITNTELSIIKAESEKKEVKKVVKVIKKITKSKTIDDMSESTNKSAYQITNSSVECIAKERVLPAYDITNTELSIVKAEPEKEVKKVKKIIKIVKKSNTFNDERVKEQTESTIPTLATNIQYQITNSALECLADVNSEYYKNYINKIYSKRINQGVLSYSIVQSSDLTFNGKDAGDNTSETAKPKTKKVIKIIKKKATISDDTKKEEPVLDIFSFSHSYIVEAKKLSKSQTTVNKSMVRKDSFGNVIVKGQKTHKVTYNEEQLVDVVNVENYKEFNKTEDEEEELDESVGFKILELVEGLSFSISGQSEPVKLTQTSQKKITVIKKTQMVEDEDENLSDEPEGKDKSKFKVPKGKPEPKTKHFEIFNNTANCFTVVERNNKFAHSNIIEYSQFTIGKIEREPFTIFHNDDHSFTIIERNFAKHNSIATSSLFISKAERLPYEIHGGSESFEIIEHNFARKNTIIKEELSLIATKKKQLLKISQGESISFGNLKNQNTGKNIIKINRTTVKQGSYTNSEDVSDNDSGEELSLKTKVKTLTQTVTVSSGDRLDTIPESNSVLVTHESAGSDKQDNNVEKGRTSGMLKRNNTIQLITKTGGEGGLKMISPTNKQAEVEKGRTSGIVKRTNTMQLVTKKKVESEEDDDEESSGEPEVIVPKVKLVHRVQSTTSSNAPQEEKKEEVNKTVNKAQTTISRKLVIQKKVVEDEESSEEEEEPVKVTGKAISGIVKTKEIQKQGVGHKIQINRNTVESEESEEEQETLTLKPRVKLLSNSQADNRSKKSIDEINVHIKINVAFQKIEIRRRTNLIKKYFIMWKKPKTSIPSFIDSLKKSNKNITKSRFDKSSLNNSFKTSNSLFNNSFEREKGPSLNRSITMTKSMSFKQLDHEASVMNKIIVIFKKQVKGHLFTSFNKWMCSSGVIRMRVNSKPPAKKMKIIKYQFKDGSIKTYPIEVNITNFMWKYTKPLHYYFLRMKDISRKLKEKELQKEAESWTIDYKDLK